MAFPHHLVTVLLMSLVLPSAAGLRTGAEVDLLFTAVECVFVRAVDIGLVALPPVPTMVAKRTQTIHGVNFDMLHV